MPIRPALHPGGFEDRGENVRGRGLAVGAGDPDQRELLARTAEELRGKRGERQPPVLTWNHGVRVPGRSRSLGEHRDRTSRDGLAHVRRAVGLLSAQRDEHGSRGRLARVIDHAGHHRIRRELRLRQQIR